MMQNDDMIERLEQQRLPVIYTDIPFIRYILKEVSKEEQALTDAPYLNIEIPITVVDKELMK